MRFPDPVSDFPLGIPQALLGAVLVVAATVSGWIVVDTQRAMNWMAGRQPEWWPWRSMAIRLANKPAWIWFYRIDCAVVFVAVVLMLVSHWVLPH